jgi:hypothetical protein
MIDYWFDQRYEAAFFATHGHESQAPCPSDCPGRGDEANSSTTAVV